MPVTSKTVDFKDGKLTETVIGSTTPTVIIASIKDQLAAATECYHGQFTVPPSTVDLIVSLANITTAHAIFLLSDGVVSVKINASAVAVPFDTTLILVGTAVTACTISNAHLTETRVVEIYLATTTT